LHTDIAVSWVEKELVEMPTFVDVCTRSIPHRHVLKVCSLCIGQELHYL